MASTGTKARERIMLLGLGSRNTVGIQQQVMYKRSMKVLDCDTILSRAWPRVICQARDFHTSLCRTLFVCSRESKKGTTNEINHGRNPISGVRSHSNWQHAQYQGPGTCTPKCGAAKFNMIKWTCHWHIIRSKALLNTLFLWGKNRWKHHQDSWNVALPLLHSVCVWFFFLRTISGEEHSAFGGSVSVSAITCFCSM